MDVCICYLCLRNELGEIITELKAERITEMKKIEMIFHEFKKKIRETGSC